MDRSSTLTNKEILEEIQHGRLVTDSVAPELRVRGCSFDLTVGTIFWKGCITSAKSRSTSIVIPPGGVVGIFTREELILPDDMFATAYAINNLSSKGFLVLNPGHVDPGFRGALTVKALNIRKTPIAISIDQPIFTVTFHRLASGVNGYPHNSPRKDRERDFNAESVQSSPDTIASMLEVDPNGPFPSRTEVKELVRGDAINRTTMLLAFFAALFAFLDFFRDQADPPQPESAQQPSHTTKAGESLPATYRQERVVP